MNSSPRLIFVAAIGLALARVASGADARYDTPLINELFFDPPADDVAFDPVTGKPVGQEYIELRGAPGMSLDGHWLIMTEAENTTNPSNPTGNIDHVFNLSGKHIGTNGYLLILPKNFEVFRPLNQIAPGTAVYQNAGTSVGFGSGSGSSIGADDQGGDGKIENGAFAALLLKVNSGLPPFVDFGIDSNRNGVIDPELGLDWTVHDSVGQFEPGEDNGISLASVTFTETPLAEGNFPPNGVNVYTAREPEYVLRYGASAGTAAADWLMANVTNNTVSGFTAENQGENGYPVSGPHTLPLVTGELIRGLPIPDRSQPGLRNLAPEGTVLQNTLGRPNWPVPDGDLNQNLSVDQDDLNVVLSNFGQVKPQHLGYWLGGDPSGNGIVEQDDLNVVLSNWGRTAANQGYNAAGGQNAQALRTAPATGAALAVGTPTLNADFVSVTGGSNHPANTVTSDLKVATTTDWLSNAVLIQLTEGTIYQNPGGTDTAPPSAFIISILPEAVYDTYLQGPNGSLASLAGGAVNLGGGTEASFTPTLIDATYFTTGTGDIGELFLGRFTFSNDATGTFAFRITALDQDPLLITGSIVNGQFVVPEPTTLSLLGLPIAAGLLRRRRRA